MKRGRPMTPTPSASTERSRKSREKAAEKARNEKIIEARKARKEKIIDAYNEPHIQPEHFAMVPQPSEPITVESPRLGRRTMLATLRPKGNSWPELRRRRRQKD